MLNRDIRPGDIVLYRRTRARAETLPRFEVDVVWRDGVLMFDSGRVSAELTG